MAASSRVEVICAAGLKGPGQYRWSEAALSIAAVEIFGKIHVYAKFRGVGAEWTYSFKPTSESEAVKLVNAIASRPADFICASGAPLDAAEATKAALVAGLKLEFLVDTTQGLADFASDVVTIGLGRYLAGRVEQGAEITPDLAVGIKRYFAEAPIKFGYWAPYKRLIKLLEKLPGAETLLALALARIDRESRYRWYGREELAITISRAGFDFHGRPGFKRLYFGNVAVARPLTLDYLMRRGVRWLRKVGLADPSRYVQCAVAFLGAADVRDASIGGSTNWILGDILFGRGALVDCKKERSQNLPPRDLLYDRRWDPFPDAWNERMDAVRRIWQSTTQSRDIQAWAFNVLTSQRQNLPSLSIAGLGLALLSPSVRLQAYACKTIAAESSALVKLDTEAIKGFLESSSPRQFSAVFPVFEANAHVKAIQDAVLAFTYEHGLFRTDAMTTNEDKRLAKLSVYCLRVLRPRLSADEIFRLARYVWQTTKFKPVATWIAIFNELPLKLLLDLRQQLPDLTSTVARLIDDACRKVVERSEIEESLAAGLTLSPSRKLRNMGWRLLTNASDAPLAAVWDGLIAQADQAKGMKLLLEALRFEDRVARIERHPSGVQLLSRLAIACSSATPGIAANLVLRLAAKGDSLQTLATIERVIDRTINGGRAPIFKVLQKILGVDSEITRLTWASVKSEHLSALAQRYIASNLLAGAIVDTVDIDEVRSIAPAQASYLTQALRLNPSRLYRDRGFGVACATCPHPELQQLSIARLESHRLVGPIFVPLAESGMPAAIAAAERHILSINDRSAFTKAVIAICDSGVRETRVIGMHIVEFESERLDLNALVLAMTEHSAPEITAMVARFAAAGVVIKREALAPFENRVLRTRRCGRKAKELVKKRISTTFPDAAVPIAADPKVDDGRLTVLISMARGASLRDRDWALQQLACLALQGLSIPQLRLSKTT